MKRILTFLSPILGAGAIGVCPLCWIGSASLLTYLGLGALIPVWRWIGFGLIALGAVGFALDYRAHKNPKPLMLLVVGAMLLYVGRYVFSSTWGAWQIWGVGAILIIVAVVLNKKQFARKGETHEPTLFQCSECKLWYREKELADKCRAWCSEHKSCNLEIIQHAVKNKQ